MNYQDQLDKIVPLLPTAFKEKYKVAGWLMKWFGFEQTMRELPKVDLLKLREDCGEQDIYKYLRFHLQQLGWQSRAKDEKERVSQDMEAVGDILGKMFKP